MTSAVLCSPENRKRFIFIFFSSKISGFFRLFRRPAESNQLEPIRYHVPIDISRKNRNLAFKLFPNKQTTAVRCNVRHKQY